MAIREKTAQVRQQIIEATDDLLYHKGFNLMSFSDIASAANVPRGNLYYYFKTKDEVLAAVVEHRLAGMEQRLREWEEQLSTPLERLKRFARIPLHERDNVTQYGCPMGSLNTELGKVQDALQQTAKAQFDVFRDWLVKQFRQFMDKSQGTRANELALHMLVRTQGIATLAHIYNDPELITREVDSLEQWLDSLESGK